MRPAGSGLAPGLLRTGNPAFSSAATIFAGEVLFTSYVTVADLFALESLTLRVPLTPCSAELARCSHPLQRRPSTLNPIVLTGIGQAP